MESNNIKKYIKNCDIEALEKIINKSPDLIKEKGGILLLKNCKRCCKNIIKMEINYDEEIDKRVKVMELLLENRADINAKNKDKGISSFFGEYTLLTFMCEQISHLEPELKKFANLIELALKYGAKLEMNYETNFTTLEYLIAPYHFNRQNDELFKGVLRAFMKSGIDNITEMLLEKLLLAFRIHSSKIEVENILEMIDIVLNEGNLSYIYYEIIDFYIEFKFKHLELKGSKMHIDIREKYYLKVFNMITKHNENVKVKIVYEEAMKSISQLIQENIGLKSKLKILNLSDNSLTVN